VCVSLNSNIYEDTNILPFWGVHKEAQTVARNVGSWDVQPLTAISLGVRLCGLGGVTCGMADECCYLRTDPKYLLDQVHHCWAVLFVDYNTPLMSKS